MHTVRSAARALGIVKSTVYRAVKPIFYSSSGLA